MKTDKKNKNADILNPAKLFALVEVFASEKKIDKNAVIQTFREPIALAIKRDLPGVTETDVLIDYYIPQVGEKSSDEVKQREYSKAKFDVYVLKTVSEEITNPNTQITPEDAAEARKFLRMQGYLSEEIKKALETERVPVKTDTFHFTRNSANAAKQRMRLNVRDAEKSRIARKYKDIIGYVKSAEAVEILDNGHVKVRITDRGIEFDTVLFKSDQVPGEVIKVGDRIPVYGVGTYETEIKIFNEEQKKFETRRKSELKISRSHKELVRILLEREIPEIKSKIVEIKAVSRVCGIRTKIAVTSKDPNVDPIGACLGENGQRLKSVLYAIRGSHPLTKQGKSEESQEKQASEEVADAHVQGRMENIDVILYNDDPAEYIRAALKPAEVKTIEITDEGNADVIVSEENMTGVIGIKGHNAKLAALLTGYVLSIIPETGIYKPKPELRESSDGSITELDETEEENSEQ